MKYRILPNKPVKKKSHYDEDGTWSLVEPLAVFEEDLSPEFTGILNSHGEPIYRFHEKRKIGFNFNQNDDDDEYEEY